MQEPLVSDDFQTASAPGMTPDWLRPAIAIAACGYGLVTVSLTLAGVKPLEARLVEGVVALVCAVAFQWSKREVRRAGLLAIGAIWIELAWTIFFNRAVDATSTLVFPALVVALGLILGERWIVRGATISAVSVPLCVLAGEQVFGPCPRQNWADLFIIEVIFVASAMFARAVMRAFTEMHLLSERLRRRYTRLFQDAPDGLVELDREGCIVEANPAAERLLGGASGELRGGCLRETLVRTGFERPADLREAAPGMPLRVASAAAGGAAARSLEITASAAPHGDGSSLLVLRDVSASSLQAERHAQTQRLETVGRLAGGVAHDFNNLLTAIGGNAGMLKGHRDPEVRKFAGDIVTAQQRAAEMIRRLLAFARHDFHQPEVFSLSRELVEWGDTLRRLTKDHCRLEVTGGGTAWIDADRVQVEQVLVNLVTNARDASPEGGRIELRLARIGREEAAARGSTLEAAVQAVLEVQDWGTGMSEEVQRRLFEPFFTTKPPGQGTGLGLAAVHGLVTQNHGAIDIATAPGAGTTVRVFLPVVAAPAGASSRHPQGTEPAAGAAIVVVEPDRILGPDTVRGLERGRHRVVTVADGFEALRLLRSGELRVGLVVVGMNLPGMPGSELAARIRRQSPELPVLGLCTPFEPAADWPRDDALCPMLRRPVAPDDLLAHATGLIRAE